MRNRHLQLPSPPPADQATHPVAALFREQHGGLVRLALLMVGDVSTAEDVAAPAHLLPVDGGFTIGWIGRGALHRLPITQPYLPSNSTLIIAW